MTGAEHYAEAERLLTLSAEAIDWGATVAQAQVHATLALAEAVRPGSEAIAEAHA